MRVEPLRTKQSVQRRSRWFRVPLPTRLHGRSEQAVCMRTGPAKVGPLQKHRVRQARRVSTGERPRRQMLLPYRVPGGQSVRPM